MAIADRKARELANREQLILEKAKHLFSEYGYDGVSMDQIAEAVEYSKGVLYKHFSSKEELYMALCAEELDSLARSFEEAVRGGGTARERLIRIGEAYIRECLSEPGWFLAHFQMDSSPRNSREGRSPREIIDQMRRGDDRSLRLVAEIIQEGQERGEFRKDVGPLQLAAIFWAETLGFLVLIAAKDVTLTDRGVDLIETMRKSWDYILDGICPRGGGGAIE